MYISRTITPPNRSFFLLGPRATGKSTWLKHCFKDSPRIDLLRNDTYFEFLKSPERLREQVLCHSAKRAWFVIDEIQRIPILLNDVHSLIEDHGYRFVLSGSSARKLRRGHVNLLAGRAFIKHLFPLTYAEFQNNISLDEALAFGTLPNVVMDKETRIEQLEAYVGTYLREEIREEALTRNVQSFSRFLDVAALMNGQVTNLSNIARDAAVPRATVGVYFEILVDTLLGFWLPAWTPKAKVREISHAKFYFFDCGIVRAIQKLLRDPPSSEAKGTLFETYIFQEINAYLSYHDVGGELFYWRTPSGTEVDFIWKRGDKIVAIEVKSTSYWKREHSAGLISLSTSSIQLAASYGIYLGEITLKKDFGLVLPWRAFLERLYAGEILY